MFRWCAYCQHLIGEAEPLESYKFSHGICPACEIALESGPEPTPESLAAAHLLSQLMAGGVGSDEGRIESFLEEAERFGLRPSDILIGVIQPALYEIGRLWETNEITVGDEHRFTQLCLKLYSRLPLPPPATGPTSILLALSPDNRHDIGVRILERLALEHGVRCRVLPTGTSATAIVAAAQEEKPNVLGLSMSLPSSAETAKGILALCAQAVPGLRLLIGGRAVRDLPQVFFPDANGARRIDDFLAELARLAPSRA